MKEHKRIKCVRTGRISVQGVDHMGWGLVKGAIYTTDGVVILNNEGEACFFINELMDIKLTQRFVWADEESEKMEEQIEEQIKEVLKK